MPLPFEIEKNIALLRAEVEKEGAELIEITFRRIGGRHILTVTADKAGGITLDDCARINRRLSDLLDEIGEGPQSDPLLGGAYDLEVVSPGLDRPLTNKRDFLKVVGEIVRMTFKSGDGRVLTWTGKVVSVSDQALEFELKDKARKLINFGSVIHAGRQIQINSKK